MHERFSFFDACFRTRWFRRGALLALCVGTGLWAAPACSSDAPNEDEDGADEGGAGAPQGGRDGNGGEAGGEATGGASSGAAGENTGGGGRDDGGAGGTDVGGSTGQGGDAGSGAIAGSDGGTSMGGSGTSMGGSGTSMGGGGTSMGGGGIGGAAGNGTSGSGGSAGSPACAAPCLVHRYSFNGSGMTVTDSVGTAHGTAVGCSLSAGGITMAGGTSDQYVDLPDGILASLTDATFEAWVTWSGTGYWQRIFDFGSSTGGVGQQGMGVTYLFLTARTSSSLTARVAYSLSGETGETFVNAPGALPSLSMTDVAVVVNDSANTLSLYVNGALSGSPAAFSGQLSSIQGVNDWLGRSQFTTDEEFSGTIHEFRIYGVARSASELQASYAAGPDSAPTQ